MCVNGVVKGGIEVKKKFIFGGISSDYVIIVEGEAPSIGAEGLLPASHPCFVFDLTVGPQTNINNHLKQTISLLLNALCILALANFGQLRKTDEV